MTPQPTGGAVASRYMQGIAVPETSVNPEEFFARTRRRMQPEVTRPFAGLGQTDVVDIKRTDIISALILRFVGTLTVTVPAGAAVGTTRRWPYDLLRQCRFTANGQSNIINCSGAKLKVREFTARADLNDRGVEQSIDGATRRQGTLAQASESWGVGSGAAAVAAGNYDVDLEWFLPIAEDQVDLLGAIFAATSSTELNANIDWAPPGELFTLAGGGGAALAGSLQAEAVRYSIPIGADGQIVVPDLSMFHSLIQNRSTDIANGGNEPKLVGQGAGKTLLRVFTQLWNGAGVGAPLAVNAANYGRLAWRYSGNETPDEFPDGGMLRIVNERMYGVDIGRHHGVFCHEFAQENAFRDTVDLATTSEFRQLITVQPGVAIDGAAAEVTTETIFVAGTGA